jgi:hypothetical protein
MRKTRRLKSQVHLGALFCAGISALVVAQEQPPVGSADAASRGRDGAEITMVGCLMRTDTSAWRPGPGTAHESGNERKPQLAFVLKSAADSPEAVKGSRREIGLRVEGMKIDEHVKHIVEVKGRLGDGSTTDDGKSSLRTLSEGGNPLQVKSIRTLKANCEET